MKALDPGHLFELSSLDGDGVQQLQFVKRIGEMFPGNIGEPKEGTTIQEVLRALISRVQYVNTQIPHSSNIEIEQHLRSAIWCLEKRAAERHERLPTFFQKRSREVKTVELIPTCPKCGHIYCEEHL